MASITFEKARRLRRRSDFERVFATGRRAQGRFVTMMVAPNGSGDDRLGIVASRKLGNAVRRNRAKRLIRELFRHRPAGAGRQGVDIVVIPRRELFDATYPVLENDYLSVFRRCTARIPHHVTQ